MVSMRSARCFVSLLCGLLAIVVSVGGAAQIAPRLTGNAVIAQLDAAKQELAARAGTLHDDRLAAASDRLGQMAAALRKSLGNKADQPIETIDDSSRIAVLRADAAVQRTRAYLDNATGCPGSDAKAMAAGLATNIDQLASTPGSSKAAQPVISAVETIDHHPLFALHPSSTSIAFALVGTNLSDVQCADPQVTATDEQGKPIDPQPVVTGVLPTRIELKLPSGAGNKSGAYVLHVVPKHKAFLVGCATQPEALAVLQIAPPLRVSVSYNLTATCDSAGSGQSIPLSSGALPDIVAYGGTSSRQVDTATCPNPSRYAISAKVVFGDGSSTSVGPIEQSADADITVGLPAGLSMSWSPSVRTIFVRSTANICKGIY
jgi:hypothetical protein